MAVVVAILAGLLLGVVLVVFITALRGRDATGGDAPSAGARPRRREPMPAETMLELLPTAVVLVDTFDNVRLANRAATTMGLVRADSVDVPELRTLVRTCRHERQPQMEQVVLDPGGFPRRVITVGARAEVLPDGDVALIVDDLTEAKRVESVRRDFVANVGHEIKTPVGALTLLAEAALDARDDPEAVQRFVGRMQREASRLSRLVTELLDLSRLQGGEPLPTMTAVRVDALVDEAVDRTRPSADAKRIELVRGGDRGLCVMGDENQLVTALSNLLDNAVAYSPEQTKVALGVRDRDDAVEISVTDQGVGIDAADRERIFERFYRADPARSRDTGGTGLGLAIVKHIVSNHGGEVTVWSQMGSGSTFTMRLPQISALPEPTVPTVEMGATVSQEASGT